MTYSLLRRFLAIVMAVSMANFGLVHCARAAVIGTDTVVRLDERAQAISRIEAQLARDEVREALIRYGVDPNQAQARVSALTDAEIAQLDQEIGKLPAGGDAGWVVLFIVLAVLIYLFATDKLQYR
jgi:hypothetical protein